MKRKSERVCSDGYCARARLCMCVSVYIVFLSRENARAKRVRSRVFMKKNATRVSLSVTKAFCGIEGKGEVFKDASKRRSGHSRQCSANVRENNSPKGSRCRGGISNIRGVFRTFLRTCVRIRFL